MARAAALSLVAAGAVLMSMGCISRRMMTSLATQPLSFGILESDCKVLDMTAHVRLDQSGFFGGTPVSVARKGATVQIGPLSAQTAEGQSLQMPPGKLSALVDLASASPEIIHSMPDGRELQTKLQLAGPIVLDVSGADHLSRLTLPVKIDGIDLLAMDYGWLLKHPGKLARDRCMTNFVIAQSKDTAVLLACDQSWRFEIDPAGQLSATVLHRAATVRFYVIIAPAGHWVDLVQAYRKAAHAGWAKPVPAPQRQRLEMLVGRMVVDDWSAIPFDQTPQLLERLRFLGGEQLVVVRHNWQHYGYDVKLPDIWPPVVRFGGLEGMKKLSDYCRASGILFGLHENFDDLYRDAPTFDDWALAYQPRECFGDGKPREYTGWYNESTKQRAVRHTADSALRAMRRNLERQRQLSPTAIFLDVTSYCDPDASETPSGTYVGVEESLQAKRGMYLQAADIVAGPALGEGCTEKYLDAVHGANCDLWDVDRWGNKAAPADWEFFPLLDWLAHDRVVFQGVGYPARFGEPTQIPFTARLYEQSFLDNYTSTNILFGHAPLYFVISAGFSADPLKMASCYWTGVPFHKVVGLQPIESVATEPDNIHRLSVKYPGSTQIWVNRADEPWRVNGVTLGKYGYLVQAPNFRQRLAIDDGHPLEVIEGKGLLYIDFRGHRRVYSGVEADGIVLLRQVDDGLEVIPLAGNTRPARVDIGRTGLWPAKGAIRAERVDLTGARRLVQVTGAVIEIEPQQDVAVSNLVEVGTRPLHKLVVRAAAQ